MRLCIFLLSRILGGLTLAIFTWFEVVHVLLSRSLRCSTSEILGDFEAVNFSFSEIWG